MQAVFRKVLVALKRASASPWSYAGVLATAVLLWAVLVARQSPEAIFYGGDPKQYWGLASSVLRTGEYSYVESHTRMRPPLYPLFLAAIRRIFGDTLLPVQAAQLLLLLAALAAVFLIARSIQDRWVAFVPLVLSALWAPWLQQTVLVMSDILFITLFLWAVYLVYLAAERQNIYLSLCVGVVIGLLALTRSLGAFLAPFAVGVLIAFRPRRLLLAGALLLAFGITVLPWATRNWLVAGEFTILGTDGGWGLWDVTIPSNAIILGQLPPGELEMKQALLGDRFEWSREANALFYQAALKNIAADPWGYFWRNALKLVSTVLWLPHLLFTETRLGLMHLPFAIGVFLAHLSALALAGFGALASWRRHRLWVTCLGGSIVYLWALHFPFFVNLRYFLALEPLLFVLAAPVLVGLLERTAKAPSEDAQKVGGGDAPPML